MSNRYVWARYNRNSEYEKAGNWGSTQNHAENGEQKIAIASNESQLARASGTYDPTEWHVQIKNPDETVAISRGNPYTVPQGKYFYMLGGLGTFFATQATTCKYESDYITAMTPSVPQLMLRYSKGSANGTVSNSGASTYPPRDYPSKSARIWPYSAPGMRGSGRASTSMYPLLGAALTM